MYVCMSICLSVCPLRPRLTTPESMKGLSWNTILCSYVTSAQIVIWLGNRGNAVDAVTGLRAGQSNLCRERHFPPECEKGLWGPTSLLFNWYRGSFPGLKWPKREVGYSPISRVNVENEWSYTSIPCMPIWREEGRLRLYLARYDWRVQTIVKIEQEQ